MSTTYFNYLSAEYKEDVEKVLRNLPELSREERMKVIAIARRLDDAQEAKYTGQPVSPDRTNVNLADDIIEMCMLSKYWRNRTSIDEAVTIIHDAWAVSKPWLIYADDMETLEIKWNSAEFAVTDEACRMNNLCAENMLKNRSAQFVSTDELEMLEKLKDIDTLKSILQLGEFEQINYMDSSWK